MLLSTNRIKGIKLHSPFQINSEGAPTGIIEYVKRRDFPGGPVVKTPGSQCRRPGFNPWSGNWIPYAATKRMHITTTDFKKKKRKDLTCCN